MLGYFKTFHLVVLQEDKYNFIEDLPVSKYFTSVVRDFFIENYLQEMEIWEIKDNQIMTEEGLFLIVEEECVIETTYKKK